MRICTNVNVRLWSWLGQHYHTAPHTGLMGRCRAPPWRLPKSAPWILSQRLRDALTVRERRRVRRDTTVSIEGLEFELDQWFSQVSSSWPPGARSTTGWCLAELHGKRYPLHAVDGVANSQRKRPLRRPDEPSAPQQTDFDPNHALLEQAVGRDPSR